MVYIAFIIGTAGSGKSLLTASFSEWLRINEQNVATLNLDPGVIKLPYTPDIDVRDYITIDEIMDEYELGPNGALIMAADLIASEVENLRKEIEDVNPDILLIDTPGQMELFAYRKSGPFIVHGLRGEGKVIVFLSDPWMLNTPENFLSVMLLASSVRIRFKLPFLHLLSKIDAAKEEAKKVMKWSSNPHLIEEELMKIPDGENYLMYTSLYRYMLKKGLIYKLIPMSSVTRYGFPDVSAAISNLFKGGEEMAG